MFKKLLTFVCIFVFAFAQICSAFSFPKSYFDIQNQLDSASASNDYRGIIDAAERQYNMVAAAPLDSDTSKVMATKSYLIAECYEKLGEYDEAAKWYELAIEPNAREGFDDAVTISKSKMSQFSTCIGLYKRTYNTVVDYDAKNENDIGVMTGIVFDSPTQSELSNSSMIMIYYTHGDDFNGYYESFLEKAEKEGKAVEFAYNMSANSAADIGMINMSQTQIQNIANILARYPGVPVYFRFAGEVNAWDVRPNPQEYKQAFRTVADIMRSTAPNVAMVYGLNFVSSWGVEFTDYYPGDEYVDWIGVSLYCKRYFRGVPSPNFRSNIDEIMFYAGYSAKPVHMMEDIVAIFGDIKPIMVFESGATGHVVTSGEYTEAWASRAMSEIFNYLPMKYPQIKIIGYFDQFVYGEQNDYSLKNHLQLKNHYNGLVTAPHIVKNTFTNDNVSGFVNCDNGFSVYRTVENLSVYAHVFGSDYEKVDYFVDDVWVASSDKIPYSCDIDFSAYAPGTHVLRYNVSASDGRIYSKSVNFNVMENIKISVGGKELTGLDQPPVAINGRTVVPVRALYEALGATVDWDGATETVTATKGNDVVSMKIGSKDIMKNGTLYCTTDVSPKTINGRTLIPARIAAELFDKSVGWSQETQTVIIE